MTRFLIAALHFDEDVDVRLAKALQERGYDVLTTAEAGLLGSTDEVQLAFAVSQERAFVTHNIKHFPGIHTRWLAEGHHHWGIILLMGQSLIGIWLRRMETLLALHAKETLRNNLFFLGVAFDD